MDKDAFKTRVTNSQLAGLHVAAAVFVVIGIGAEIAVGNPAKPEGNLDENFNSALMDPAWIVMRNVPGQDLADCLSPTQIEQVDGHLSITATQVETCQGPTGGRLAPRDSATKTTDLVASGFVRTGFALPRYGHLHTELALPTGEGVAPFIALTHHDGRDAAMIVLSGDQATVHLDGAVRAHTTIPHGEAGTARTFDARIGETSDGVRFELSIDGETILDHTESTALKWVGSADAEATWVLEFALGVDDAGALPQSFGVDSVRYASARN